MSNMDEIRNAPLPVLLKKAEEMVLKNTNQSRLFHTPMMYNNESKVPVFAHSEMTLGRIIGRGGFCTVTEITSFQSDGAQRRSTWMFSKSANNSQRGLINRGTEHLPSEMSVHGGTELSQKEYMSYRAMRGGQCRYVIKNVAAEWVFQNRVTFLKGVVDLAIEAKFLCSLQHPNIMELRGLAEGGPYQENYFIVLDKLHSTLPKMMKDWTTRDRQCKGITGTFVGGKKKVAQLMVDRLRAAFDIASAMAYLHSLGLVYRDLKPDNLGFDARGVVKMFDFGLTKELKDEDRNPDGLYRLTGFTGSIRYMAPEVGLRRPYNEKADVYSFSMLLWYILALEPPYGFYTPDMFLQRVFIQGHRPMNFPEWPDQLNIMIKRGWDNRINVRPDFKIIMQVIKKETVKVDAEAGARMVLFNRPVQQTTTHDGR